MQRARKPFDLEGLVKRSTSGRCFICEFLQGNPAYKHHVVAETDAAIAFLAKYPTLYGYVLVAPKQHVEQVTGDFDENVYLELQSLIYRVSEAIRTVLAPERMYILSLGSQAANSHVHWHVAPLPHGLPLEQQQYYALMHENGVVDTTPEEMAKLAQNLRSTIGASRPGA
jgi:diadenosine tetraphosphate (Ap4A) HIT family hydrolase